MESKKTKLRFFSWFRSEYKIKRWLLLAIISASAICWALSTIFVTDTLNFGTIIKIALLFIFGFSGIVVSYISMQKRVLEIMVKKTDKRDNVKSLIYNKKVYSQGPKIVVIGGGTGLNTVLKGLKNYTENITAVVTGYDTSRSNFSGRKSSKMAEDIKESIIALAKNETEMRNIIECNFSKDSENPLTFGDMYVTEMQRINHDLSKSIERAKDVFNITGTVLPVTSDSYEICADYTGGHSVQGKENIYETMCNVNDRIDRVYLSPSNVKTSSEVITAIKEADAIVIGPGSLYTSIIPNLLVKGVSRAIKESSAFTVYISNIMTQPEETCNFSLSDHIKAIKRHLGEASIDYCIYDTGDVIPEYIRKYNSEGADLVNQDIQNAKAEGVKLIKRDLATITEKHIRHDSDLVAKAIIDLICEDLKFKDKQNDPEYIFLRQQMRYKKLKPNSDSRWKKRKFKDGKSKFYSKYQERVDSLKDSEEKIKRMNKTTEKNDRMLERVSTMRNTKYNKGK